MSDQSNPFDDKASSEELAAAAALADQVDDLLGGTHDIDSEVGDLFSMATMLHSANHEAELSQQRETSIIEEAMASAVPGTEIVSLTEVRAKRDEKSPEVAAQQAKPRWGWRVVATLAIAAGLFLLLRIGSPMNTNGQHVAMTLKSEHQSRASDALVGPIPEQDTGLASKRVKTIYGDRMNGYRALRYQRLLGAQ